MLGVEGPRGGPEDVGAAVGLSGRVSLGMGLRGWVDGGNGGVWGLGGHWAPR